MNHGGQLPEIKRYITTHNSEGKAVFSNAIPEENPIIPLDDEIGFALSYTFEGVPADLTNEADIETYKSYREKAPELAIPNGSVLRHVDFAPNLKHVMHRTLSIDYGICLAGEIECVLDSGERRRLKVGDVCIQRGTSHAWENPTDKWARMVFCLTAAKPVVVADQEMGEDVPADVKEAMKSKDKA